MSTIEQRRVWNKRYWDKHPEKRLENNIKTAKRHIERYRTDPEFRKKCLEQAKRTAIKSKNKIKERKQTPEYKAVERAYNLKRRLQQRNFRLKQKYGITHEQFEKISESQNHVCAICGGVQKHGDKWGSPNRRLRVDHDHATGKVRGLLCTMCNLGIGYFQDNPPLFDRAKEYLLNSILPPKV